MTDHVLITADGSRTLKRGVEESYHSRHGALTESRHVFIAASGLATRLKARASPVSILEVGFGTGLNCALAADLATAYGCEARYTGLENRVISAAEFTALDHAQWLDHPGCAHALHRMLVHHAANPSGPVHARCGTLDVTLVLGDAVTTTWHHNRHDVVFHDAFSPETSMSLWTDSFLDRLMHCVKPGGVLVTYCAKGRVRRAFESAACRVERLPGPPGKREMLRVHPATTWQSVK